MNLYSVSFNARINKMYICTRTAVIAASFDDAAVSVTNEFGYLPEFKVDGVDLKAENVEVPLPDAIGTSL